MNYYKKAIDILANNKNIHDRLLVEVAKNNPGALVAALKSFKRATWIDTVRPLYAAGRKIDAIKECRALTGMNLKEAKAAVESIKI